MDSDNENNQQDSRLNEENNLFSVSEQDFEEQLQLVRISCTVKYIAQ